MGGRNVPLFSAGIEMNDGYFQLPTKTKFAYILGLKTLTCIKKFM